MTDEVEFMDGTGRCERLTVPRVLVPDLLLAEAAFRTDNGRRNMATAARIYSQAVAEWERLPWDTIPADRLCAFLCEPTPESDMGKAIQAFYAPSLSAWTSVRVEARSLHHLEIMNTLLLHVYLVRAALSGATWADIARDLGLVLLWRFAWGEFSNRGAEHPVALGLFFVALASPDDRARFDVDRLAMEWVRVASRPGVIHRDWAWHLLGGDDHPHPLSRKDLELDIEATVLDRLGEEAERLRAAEVEQTLQWLIEGKLDFHKMAAKYALLNENQKRYPTVPNPDGWPAKVPKFGPLLKGIEEEAGDLTALAERIQGIISRRKEGGADDSVWRPEHSRPAGDSQDSPWCRLLQRPLARFLKNLTKKERKAFDTLRRLPEAQALSADRGFQKRLAKAAGVSNATVTRLFEKIRNFLSMPA